MKFLIIYISIITSFSAAASGGVSTLIDATRLNEVMEWVENSKYTLDTELENIQRSAIPYQEALYADLLERLLRQSGDKPNEFLMRNILYRTQVVYEGLRNTPSSPKRNAMARRILEEGITWSQKLYQPDLNLLKAKREGRLTETLRGVEFAKLGVSWAEYMLSLYYVAPTNTVKYQLMKDMMGLMYNDMNNDDAVKRILAPISGAIATRNSMIPDINSLSVIAKLKEARELRRFMEQQLEVAKNLLGSYKESLLLTNRVRTYPEGGANTKFETGGQHACAIDDGGLSCWGYNGQGQIDVPKGLKNVKSVSAGNHHTCAIDDNGLHCWGNNNYGQSNVPGNLKNVRAVSAGGSLTCAIDDRGVRCWGSNSHGETTIPSNLKNVRAVSVGGQHACAIDDSGLRCWGYNGQGQIDVPYSLKNITAVSTGTLHTCAIADNGLHCWGDNDSDQTSVPNSLKNVRAVSAGDAHTCAIDDSGLRCWGSNNYGQTSVPDLKNVTSVSVGYFYTCMIDDNGPYCWGENGSGQTDIPSRISK